jgi:hypothetical protein
MSFFKKSNRKEIKESSWARPQMAVTFRTEVMPGRSREERTFRIEKVLSNNRVILRDFPGEHREGVFEPVSTDKKKI